jgi:hypothetical protein
VWGVLLLLLALGALLVWFIPLQLTVQVRQHALQATVWVQVKVLLVKLSKGVNISENVRMALEHMWLRWLDKGEPVKVPLQKTVQRFPRQKWMRVLRRPLRYLGRRTRCSHLRLWTEVGSSDAMETALLSGVCWAVIGVGLGYFSRIVRLEPNVPQVQVVPNFRAPSWRLQADCILRLRLGHAIVAGIWLLRRAWREKELIAWARDSWRRKGAEGSGRASDSGADEDGNGEPQRDG